MLGARRDHFPAEIQKAYTGLIVLGTPIGESNYVQRETKRIACSAIKNLENIKLVEDPQMEMLLLRCCAGAPKLNYWQRTCVPEDVAEAISLFDNAVDEHLSRIVGVPVVGLDRLTFHLPLSFGGVGIPIAHLSAEAAFVSSVGSTWHMQPNLMVRRGFSTARNNLSSGGTVLPQLMDKSGFSVSPHTTQSKEFRQSVLMQAMNGRIREDMRTNSHAKKEIVMKGRSCKGASYWLTTPPSAWNKTVIEAASFRALLKYSTGMKLFLGQKKCPDCGTVQDNYGHHALSCKVASGAIYKHNSIVNNIFYEMKKASIPCSKEEGDLRNNTRQRPGDIYMTDFDIYGEAFFDVSVISICAQSHYKRASKGQLEGSKIRYDQKMAKYPELGARFKPLVIESTGGWHPFSFKTLSSIADHIAVGTNKRSVECLNALLSKSAFCLQRHQGSMLVRRCLGL